MKKSIVIITLLALLAAAYSYYTGTKETNSFQADINTDIVAEKHVDLTLKKAYLSQGSQGKEEWTLEADKIEYLQASDRVDLTNPNILYVVKNGQKNVRTVAEDGYLFQKEGTIILRHHVVATQEDKTVTGNMAEYRQKDKALYMDGIVHIHSRSMQGTMKDAVWDFTKNRLSSRGAVALKVYLQSRETTDK